MKRHSGAPYGRSVNPGRACWQTGRRQLGCCLALVALIAACGAPRPVQRADWSAQQPVADLLRLDAARLLLLQDLTFEVKFTLHKVGSASGSILYQPPDLMRLDVRDPLFRRILAAVLDGDRLLAHDAAGRLYDMPARDGLDAFLDIDLAGYDPRLALLGVIAPAPAIVRVEHPRADRAQIVVDDGIDGQQRYLWFDLHSGFARREELVDVSGVIWSRDLRDWRRVGATDLYLPRSVRIDSKGHTLELDFGKIRVDRELQREKFYHGFATP